MSTQSKHWWNKVAGETPSECTCEKCGDVFTEPKDISRVEFVMATDNEEATPQAVNVCDDCLYDMRKDDTIILTN